MADHVRSTVSGRSVGASAAEVNMVGAGASDTRTAARRALGTLDIGPRASGAISAPATEPDDETSPAEGPSVARLALWGAGAAAAVVCVLFAATTDLGTRRAAAGVASIMSPPRDTASAIAQVAARSVETDRENRRLSDTVLALTSDRDRIAMRVDSVEREMGDLTGSIKRVTAQAAAARPTAVTPEAKPPELQASDIRPPETREAKLPSKTQDRQPITIASAKSAPSATADETPPVPQRKAITQPPLIPSIKPVVSMPPSPLGAIPQPKPASDDSMLNLALTAPVFGLDSKMPRTSWPAKTGAAPISDKPQKSSKPETAPAAAAPAPASTGSVQETPEPQPKAQLGIDLGPGMTMAKLRSRWNAFKATKGAEADNMMPLVMAREITPGKPVELRLIAGPVADINAAVELCATLVGTPFLCQPSVYDGQRLALH